MYFLNADKFATMYEEGEDCTSAFEKLKKARKSHRRYAAIAPPVNDDESKGRGKYNMLFFAQLKLC